MARYVCENCGENLIVVAGKFVCPDCDSAQRFAKSSRTYNREASGERFEKLSLVHPKNRGEKREKGEN